MPTSVTGRSALVEQVRSFDYQNQKRKIDWQDMSERIYNKGPKTVTDAGATAMSSTSANAFNARYSVGGGIRGSYANKDELRNTMQPWHEAAT